MSDLPIYLSEEYGFEERARDLVSRMTLEEKASQLVYTSPAIPHLGVTAYNWWNEALHGVANAGVATMFPQAIGLAATFDENLLQKTADIIATEGRAKYHEFQRKEDYSIYKGLTFWSPNINIFRDPRWGRGQETYGEDPYLTGRLSVAFVKGLQGSDPKYLKAAACAKHYAVHSGPESERHSFNAEVSVKDLRETYLPAFRDLVKEAKVEAVMGAYNRTNGEPCCGSKTLLKDILRDEWGFSGHVVSDCGAIKDFHVNHGVTTTATESVALALKSGCDLNCGNMYLNVMRAYQEGILTEEAIETAAVRLFTTRMKLGMFDNPAHVPYASTPYEINECEEHLAAALDVAKKSLVLLKNENSLLPLKKENLKSVAVIGPNAANIRALEGNYHGTASRYVTILDGIREAVGRDTRVFYAAGCPMYQDRFKKHALPKDGISEAISAAERADVVFVCLGLDASMEGEQHDAYNQYSSGDKFNLDLPGLQQELLEALYNTGKPIVLILLSGSPLAVTWADKHIPAIIEAWYPGAEGGKAIASLLFGEYNPSGRLPITFYKTTDELPDIHDYAMKNRTYRYMQNEALYPFGYGLSYTSFTYSEIVLNSTSIPSGEDITCTAAVINTGAREGDEIVQLYLKDLEASAEVPHWQLKGFCRITLKPGESKQVTFTLVPRHMALVDNDGSLVLEPGNFRVYIGGSQPDSRSMVLTGVGVQYADFDVTGEKMVLEY